jgi:hypothetical protein
MALFKLGRILGKIALVAREQKITLGEMRHSGPRRLLVYSGDYKCSHSVDGERWPDQVWLSDLEPLFVCRALPDFCDR